MSSSSIVIVVVFIVTFIIAGLVAFFILMMVRSHRKVVAAQQERIRQMQLFSDKLQATREEEQKRIARELHDELGGTLTSIKFDLLWLEQHNTIQGEVAQRYQAIRELVDSTTKVVQRISAELRPKILDSLGLGAAIEWQVSEFKKRTGIDIRLAIPEDLPRPDETVTTGVYRIIQESLTNIVRHAQATVVHVRVEARENALHVEIIDNGKGFDAALLNHPESLGLMSIRERARMIGGNAVITGAAGKGSQVVLDAPFRVAQHTPSEESTA